MNLLRTMKAQFVVALVTTPLFVVTSLFLFWLVLQFADLSAPLFLAVAIPFLLAWSIFDRWLSRQLVRRWSQQEQTDTRQ